MSLPFNGTVLKNLLAVISSGVSFSLGRDDLLDVQNAANLLQIKLNNLNVEPSNKVAPKLVLYGTFKTSIYPCL